MNLSGKVCIVTGAASGRRDPHVRELSLERAYRAIDDREPRLVHAMNRPGARSIACLPTPMNGHFAARHFMTGVLIGTAVAALVFVLVQ
jgi:NAD(P)-dependent dehydrogenase (short-subunit alcohol dehydrogenase family)